MLFSECVMKCTCKRCLARLSGSSNTNNHGRATYACGRVAYGVRIGGYKCLCVRLRVRVSVKWLYLCAVIRCMFVNTISGCFSHVAVVAVDEKQQSETKTKRKVTNVMTVVPRVFLSAPITTTPFSCALFDLSKELFEMEVNRNPNYIRALHLYEQVLVGSNVAAVLMLTANNLDHKGWLYKKQCIHAHTHIARRCSTSATANTRRASVCTYAIINIARYQLLTLWHKAHATRHTPHATRCHLFVAGHLHSHTINNKEFARFIFVWQKMWSWAMSRTVLRHMMSSSKLQTLMVCISLFLSSFFLLPSANMTLLTLILNKENYNSSLIFFADICRFFLGRAFKFLVLTSTWQYKILSLCETGDECP